MIIGRIGVSKGRYEYVAEQSSDCVITMAIRSSICLRKALLTVLVINACLMLTAY